MEKYFRFLLGFFVCLFLFFIYRFVIFVNSSYQISIQDPNHALSWDSWEIKLPPYLCEPWTSYLFNLKRNSTFLTDFPDAVFDNNEKLVLNHDTYYAYPLSRLDIDLNVDKIFVQNSIFRKLNFVMSGSLMNEPCRFVTYQAKDRNKDQILNFLIELANWNLQDIVPILNHNESLIPFMWVLDKCWDPNWKIEKTRLVSSMVCDTESWPDILKYSLFIAHWSLYLSIQKDENPDLSLSLLLKDKIDEALDPME